MNESEQRPPSPEELAESRIRSLRAELVQAKGEDERDDAKTTRSNEQASGDRLNRATSEIEADLETAEAERAAMRQVALDNFKAGPELPEGPYDDPEDHEHLDPNN